MKDAVVRNPLPQNNDPLAPANKMLGELVAIDYLKDRRRGLK